MYFQFPFQVEKIRLLLQRTGLEDVKVEQLFDAWELVLVVVNHCPGGISGGVSGTRENSYHSVYCQYN